MGAIHTLDTRIILRNDTAERWAQYNPILIAGELGYETDTGLFKFGDGSTNWSNLPYSNDFSNLASNAHFYEFEQDENDATPADTLAAQTAIMTKKAGDFAIIKKEISEGHFSYTAFRYDGSNWRALDGNYDATNIYFDKDLVATSPIGVITIPASGSATIAAEGKNLQQVLSSILAERKNPTVTKPSITGSYTNSTKSVEAGTSVTPAYSVTFNPGSYSYGPATGVTYSNLVVRNTFTSQQKDTLVDSFGPQVMGDQTGDCANLTTQIMCNYSGGAIPKDNLGDDVADLAIAASNLTNTFSGISCYRNFFYGVLATSSEEEPLSSAVIRDLTKGGAYNSSKSFTMRANSVANAKRMVVAYPANTTRGGLTKVILPNSLNFDAFANGVYARAVNVNVEGANGYAAIPYIVYVYEPAAIDASEVHNVTLA